VNDHRFVFVCGLQRSGTTMLYRYLSEHPEISKLEGTARKGNEGQHNQTVYPDPDKLGRAGRFAFLPEARLTEDSPLVTAANREKLFAEWARYWDLEQPVLMCLHEVSFYISWREEKQVPFFALDQSFS